ncbi:hypothetical protein [Palleronia caenipelagi]|uniref:Uncharacterized protein n=1 Tax=Palleronia caenipelagi TaxID=2489174 RepID=A0A547PME7_9RHOB|nr:hypothetical protein [Palleronia caenipelagi]TRD15315.1 hypothetical protein FEV53_16875 [Palleronia caenipelagi]
MIDFKCSNFSKDAVLYAPLIADDLRACHRTAGYFTPVHERSTPWDSIDGNTRMSSKVRYAVRHWFKHRIERG